MLKITSFIGYNFVSIYLFIAVAPPSWKYILILSFFVFVSHFSILGFNLVCFFPLKPSPLHLDGWCENYSFCFLIGSMRTPVTDYG